MIKLYTDSLSDYVQDNMQFLIETLQDDDKQANNQNIDNLALEMIEQDTTDLKQAAHSFDAVGGFDKIQVCAVLGLWHGKRTGVKTFNSLSECLTRFCEDQNTFYFKRKNTTLTLAATHHDGTNIFKFYYIKNGKRYAINYNIFINCY